MKNDQERQEMKRLVNTNSLSLDLTRTYKQREFDFKPNGLWYSLDTEWMEWCEGNMRGWMRDHVIDFEVDLSKVLVLETPEHVIAFIDKYGIPLYSGTDMFGINWHRVISEYAGIEIRNYHKIKRSRKIDFREYWMKTMWFSAWDVSSGCMWDLSIIKSHTHLPVKNP